MAAAMAGAMAGASHKGKFDVRSLQTMGLSVRLWRVAFGVALAAVLVLSLAPLGPDVPGTGWDKSNHLLGFALLALLGLAAFPSHARTILAGLLAYGALIEALQSLTGYRLAEWGDWIADALGVLLGWAVVRGIAATRRGRGAGRAMARVATHEDTPRP